MPDICVRSETGPERTARQSADAPISAFLVVEIFAGAAVIREHELAVQAPRQFIRDLAAGQWDRPHRILFIDEASGICRDASAEIAERLTAEAGCGLALGTAARDFCRHHASARNAV